MTGNELKQAVLAAIQEHKLDMLKWTAGRTSTKYPCGTACCIAGWIVNCYPSGGKMLEEYQPTYLGSAVPIAAEDILGFLGLQSPDFMYSTDADVMAWLNNQPVA